MGLLDRFLDVELAPYLTPQTLFALERVSAGDAQLVAPSLRAIAELARAQGITALVTAGAPRELSAAVVRFKMLAGVDVEALSMPRLVATVYNWVHYGRRGDGRRGLKRSEHLLTTMREFPPEDGAALRGIVATMQMELRAVEVVVRLKLAFGGSLSEVAEIPLVPEDLRGMTPGGASVQAVRPRPELSATALMWAARYGTRWVKALLRLGADAQQVTAEGGSALLCGAVFESRGAVLDGATDSGEQYGGVQQRARGVVGPLLDSGARLDARMEARRFCEYFGPSPVREWADVGPVEVCLAEASRAGWAQEICGFAARAGYNNNTADDGLRPGGGAGSVPIAVA